MDFTLIIQGPLTIYTMSSLLKHKDDFKIVIVTDNQSDPNLIKEISSICVEEGHTFLMYDRSIVKPEYENSANRYFQFYSTYVGLILSSTEYVIKMRADEFYSKLDPFKEEIKNNPTKIVTNDVFFRKCYIYHPSDHLIGGTLKNMKKVFQLCKEYSENSEENKILFNINGNGEICYPEQQLGISIIQSLYGSIEKNKDTEFEIMNSCFTIVTSDKLGYFRVKSNILNSEWNNNDWFDPTRDIKHINELKELKR
jgi:hypothetical protein